MKPRTYQVFIAYKRRTGKDFALHLKDGLEAEGICAFLDIKDIPTVFKGQNEWWEHRDNALVNSEVFLLIITDGIETSKEVSKEVTLARKHNMNCTYFRHADLEPNIVINLEDSEIDLGNFNQTRFETKEDLLRKVLRDLGRSMSSGDKSTDKRGVIYCRRCGEKTGIRSLCIGVYTEHDFASGIGTIYCTRCGVRVGERSLCIGVYAEHNFVSV